MTAPVGPQEPPETIFEASRRGRRAYVAPRSGVPGRDPKELLPARLRRESPAKLPEASEPQIVRHYTRLSKRNFDLDSGFYPLGSCTMKHNPRLHERLAALPGFANLHPLQRDTDAQGALEIMWRLEAALGEIAGLPATSLHPAAGAQGELCGLLITQALQAARGEPRGKVLVADSAHGTNPATVAMAGYELVPVGTDRKGNVDLEDLRAKVDHDVACLMLTNPSTLGLFDPQVEEIARLVKGVGATLYYDGANLNAIIGRCRPGDMGFDIVHFNLHKTFTQPHGGGGPGAGPIAVSEELEPYLPRPRVARRVDAGNGQPVFTLDFERPHSIGRLRGFNGNFGVFVRSLAYIVSLGCDGLADISATAVLNANYMMAGLQAIEPRGLLTVAYERRCMHEFVLSAGALKRATGLGANDLAKRLLDYGFHPPTVYFPLMVEEALLIEPTETEPKEVLDAFVAAMAKILIEAEEEPDLLRQAPAQTPVRRVDEVGASRHPHLRQALLD